MFFGQNLKVKMVQLDPFLSYGFSGDVGFLIRQKRGEDVGFPSVCGEYVLLSLVNE